MSNLKLIQTNPHANTPEEYAAITANARIKIQARKRIGTRDDDGTAIIEQWWVERGMSSIRAENRVNRHYMSNTRIFRS